MTVSTEAKRMKPQPSEPQDLDTWPQELSEGPPRRNPGSYIYVTYVYVTCCMYMSRERQRASYIVDALMLCENLIKRLLGLTKGVLTQALREEIGGQSGNVVGVPAAGPMFDCKILGSLLGSPQQHAPRVGY